MTVKIHRISRRFEALDDKQIEEFFRFFSPSYLKVGKNEIFCVGTTDLCCWKVLDGCTYP